MRLGHERRVIIVEPEPIRPTPAPAPAKREPVPVRRRPPRLDPEANAPRWDWDDPDYLWEEDVRIARARTLEEIRRIRSTHERSPDAD